MATIPYTAGEAGTLGFPITQFDGTPMPLDGLGLRLVVYRPGDDLVLTGYASSGTVAPPDGGDPVLHPSIATFDVTPAAMTLPTTPYAYRCSLQINDGSGWRTIGDHVLNIRRP